MAEELVTMRWAKAYAKSRYEDGAVGKLTPKEALLLMDCWANESQRRYGKINMEAPLFLKLQRIVHPELTKLE